jgi:integrase/recombinase XerD
LRDVRCTLRRTSAALAVLVPGVPLWKLKLTDYLRWLEQERSRRRQPGGLQKRLSHLRCFLDYAWRSGRTERNVLDGFRLQDATSRKEPESLSLEEAERLLKSCPTSKPLERQERLVLLLLYGCGLRTKELCALRVQDLNAERQELKVEAGKGDLQRIVPIPEGVQSALWAYVLERRGRRGPLLRTSRQRRPLLSRDICRIVREGAARAEIARVITPKALRHSYATHLMDSGVDLAVIARLMGHRSPRETGVYLHALKDRPRQAVEQLKNVLKKKHPGEGDRP